MTNYAQIEDRLVYLSSDFGEEIARRWFGDETVDSLPRFVRGPRKGKIKGAVTWSKVVRGGWVRTARATANGDAEGYVETRVGRVFNRRLHEIVSSQFGTSLGKCIRDLEREEDDKRYEENRRKRIDEQIREYEMKRAEYEHILATGDYNETVIRILQKYIQDINDDIAALIEELKK